MPASPQWNSVSWSVLLLAASSCFQQLRLGNALHLQKLKDIPFIVDRWPDALQGPRSTNKSAASTSFSETTVRPYELKTPLTELSDGGWPLFFPNSQFIATEDTIDLQYERLQYLFKVVASTIKTETTMATNEEAPPRRRNGIRRRGLHESLSNQPSTGAQGNMGEETQQSYTDVPNSNEQSVPQDAEQATGVKTDITTSNPGTLFAPLSETGLSHQTPSELPSDSQASSVSQSSSPAPESPVTPNLEKSQESSGTSSHESGILEPQESSTHTLSSRGESEQGPPVGTAALMRNLVLALEEEETARQNPGDLKTPGAWQAYALRLQALQKKRQRCQLEAFRAASEDRQKAAKHIINIRSKLGNPQLPEEARSLLLGELEAWETARENSETIEAEIKALVARTTTVKIPEQSMTPQPLRPPRPSHIRDIAYTRSHSAALPLPGKRNARGVGHRRSRSAGAEVIESLAKEKSAGGSYVFE